jgi:hypothetical protein
VATLEYLSTPSYGATDSALLFVGRAEASRTPHDAVQGYTATYIDEGKAVVVTPSAALLFVCSTD